MLRSFLVATFFFTMTPLLISVQWLLGKARPARLGLHRRQLLSRALLAAARPRPRRRRSGARPRGAVRVQPCVVGRYPRHRLDCAGRLCRQARSQRAGRSSASPPNCSVRCLSTARAGSRPATPSARSSNGSTPARPSCCSRKARRATATVCCRSARRCSARSRMPPRHIGAAPTHPHSADVDQLHRPSMAFRWDASIARWSRGMAISIFMPHIKAFIDAAARSTRWSAMASRSRPTARSTARP